MFRLIVHKTGTSPVSCATSNHHDESYDLAELASWKLTQYRRGELVEIRERVPRNHHSEILLKLIAGIRRRLPYLRTSLRTNCFGYGVPSKGLGEVAPRLRGLPIELAGHLPAEAASTANPRYRIRATTSDQHGRFLTPNYLRMQIAKPHPLQ